MKTTSLSQTIAAMTLLALPAFGYAQDSGEGSKWTISKRLMMAIQPSSTIQPFSSPWATTSTCKSRRSMQ